MGKIHILGWERRLLIMIHDIFGLAVDIGFELFVLTND